MVSPSEATRKAAARYIEAGWAPIPVPPGQKNPNRRGWQNEHLRLEDVPKCWTNGQNVGVLLGSPSGGLVDVDLDVAELLPIADRFIKPTLTSGRPGAERSHRWQRIVGTIRRVSFDDLDGTRLLEIRGDGHQTIAPPSVHPSGERYAWSKADPSEAVEVELEELLRSCRELATAGLVARHLPARGRHDLGMALAGFLLRRGLDEETTQRIMHAAWIAAGCDEQRHRDAHRDIDGIVRDTAAKLAEGRETRGGRALGGIIPGLPSLISKHWEWPRHEPDPVASRNESHQEHPGFNLTDLGNAERLVHRHGDELRYCPQLGGWLAWDGTRWRPDDTGDVERLAKETIRSIYVEAGNESDDAKRKALADHAKRSESRNRIEAMIALARSEPGIPARAEEFDADPWLLNCPNGTVDLRSSTLRLHDRDDLITKVAGTEYDPQAEAPRFERFLKEVLVEDEVIDFVRRFAGYSLSGSTRERVIAILHGRGKNGKSTLIELLQVVMGDYATTTDTETILAKRYQGVGNDVAALKGARFVAAAEVEKGRRLAESKVKQLTGNDTVTARFLYSEPFSFKPEFKLWLSTNNKPEITGTDDAIWDRIRLILFEQRFDGKAADTELPEKLRAELPGILAWMVRACGEWLLDGLGKPQKVREATEGYRVEMDVLAAFIEDRCVVRERAVALATPLYEAYRKWCDENGEHPESQKKFGGWLRERGFSDDRERGSRRKIWRGIGLHDPTQPPDTGMFSDSGGGAR
jgi:putative DNA primase/helicase